MEDDEDLESHKKTREDGNPFTPEIDELDRRIIKLNKEKERKLRSNASKYLKVGNPTTFAFKCSRSQINLLYELIYPLLYEVRSDQNKGKHR